MSGTLVWNEERATSLFEKAVPQLDDWMVGGAACRTNQSWSAASSNAQLFGNKVSIQLRDFWSSQDLYYVLPNKVYFFLGAQIMDSEGESDWYSLCDALFTYPHCNVLESESRRYKKR